MKENEAKEIINNFHQWNLDDQWLEESEMCDLCETVIAALQEIQQYRSIGTVYACREAVEKQKPKIPDIRANGHVDGHPVYDMYDCPRCGESYEMDYTDYDYCPRCGQMIDREALSAKQHTADRER